MTEMRGGQEGGGRERPDGSDRIGAKRSSVDFWSDSLHTSARYHLTWMETGDGDLDFKVYDWENGIVVHEQIVVPGDQLWVLGELMFDLEGGGGLIQSRR